MCCDAARWNSTSQKEKHIRVLQDGMELPSRTFGRDWHVLRASSPITDGLQVSKPVALALARLKRQLTAGDPASDCASERASEPAIDLNLSRTGSLTVPLTTRRPIPSGSAPGRGRRTPERRSYCTRVKSAGAGDTGNDTYNNTGLFVPSISINIASTRKRSTTVHVQTTCRASRHLD